ncbi:hypothetical protein [Halalkalibacter okhensis]|uniref:Uncharacterized protein n=1 Tax=Halalkalibacter okhensis TaxID=333138 RepID=A0A0B0IEN4_9BACI|nr:hypothetical protein [Halalkalibacter okhensis]KHF39312.1 hypothetical protein LQ50_15575 [Halalkalibacter okhensis]
MKVIETMISALICTIIISLGLSLVIYIPIQQVEGFTFLSLFFSYVIYSLPIFLLGGIGASLVVEKIFKHLQLKKDIAYYPLALILYAFVGILFNYYFYFSVINKEWGNSIFYMFVGILGSCLFFHILLLTRKSLHRISTYHNGVLE